MFRSKVGLFFEAKQKISEKSYQQFADCVFLQRQKLATSQNPEFGKITREFAKILQIR